MLVLVLLREHERRSDLVDAEVAKSAVKLHLGLRHFLGAGAAGRARECSNRAPQLHIETLIIHKLTSRKLTKWNDLYW